MRSNCLNDLTGHQDVDLRERFLEALLEFFETFLRKLIVSCNDFELRDFHALSSTFADMVPRMNQIRRAVLHERGQSSPARSVCRRCNSMANEFHISAY